ncbi:acetyltransferase [Desulfosarcina ovata subsp. sediminis]|uniref:Acetyltransferase n=1 Tax=Desulfosarcina ovata subsp. sediminis TaxID=885957 RepID=A0A5K7ZK87_9BACT|nr:CatB-related O-acetyltransferase [Desulfosarcina ovata]BBO81311.1 acetyltransferase [Desulfosarcina ovata subsp. sediminis]
MSPFLKKIKALIKSKSKKYIVQYKNNKIIIPIGQYTYGPKPILVGPPIAVKNLSQGSSIGRFCSIAPGLKFIFRGKHMVNWVTTYPFRDMWGVDVPLNNLSHNNPITIGNDVWIATNVSIMQGVTVGDGAIIAQESFVTKNVPPYSIVGGHPAEIIRFRFEDKQISELLKIAWWNWEPDRIMKYIPLMLSENVNKFIHLAQK